MGCGKLSDCMIVENLQDKVRKMEVQKKKTILLCNDVACDTCKYSKVIGTNKGMSVVCTAKECIHEE